ncbi:kin of IRRE-like protein 2 isoform X2 [Planococcus citri]|uniref:kin of IRRE-like protein 2 isoform X2 n=1 Tax=Planococcus citri TaxID=170843 RepID=UPI0031F9EBF0
MKLLQFLLIYIGLFRDVFPLQSFDRKPTYTEVNGGEDTKLICVVLNKKGDCNWQKDNKPVRIQPPKYEWVATQGTGDCSLWIRKASSQFDDGKWECQVEPSDYTTQDGLSSEPAQLVVRVAPQSPRIEHNAMPVLPDHNVTVKSGDRAILKCISRYGNPPAKLKWFLDDEELDTKSNQTELPEEGTNRTFMAISTLEVYVNKSHRGRTIRCVAFHESYASKSMSVNVKLDITYLPEVQIKGMPPHDLEDGKDTLVLRCLADANPPASIIWQKLGGRDITSLTEILQFRPISQRESGTYSCIAKNSVGSSQPVTTTLDVKYGPIIKSVGPDKLTTAPLYSSTEFTCAADGNPPPTYQWLQKVSSVNGDGQTTITVRSSEPKLYFRNVTYDYQGEYICVVTNTIAGTERIVQSQPITLQVIGAPQVLKHAERQEVVVQRGESALLRLVVCADPRPRRTAWEWGSLQLEAGAGVGRYHAEELKQEGREDCYEARFHVNEVDHPDSRNYYLTVENERGHDKHVVHLTVREPLPMMTVFTVAVGSLVVFMICVLLSVYIIKSQKCCFARRGDFKPADSESEKSDINNSNGRKPPKIEPMIGNGGPNDMMYCTSPIRRPPPPHTITAAGSSPEAMKRKRKTIYESSVKSSSRSRSKKRNTFTDLQVPVVSNNGATMNRMANYSNSTKKLIHKNNEYPTYFCPFGQIKYPDEVHYNDMRTFPRHGYHAYDKDII